MVHMILPRKVCCSCILFLKYHKLQWEVGQKAHSSFFVVKKSIQYLYTCDVCTQNTEYFSSAISHLPWTSGWISSSSMAVNEASRLYGVTLSLVKDIAGDQGLLIQHSLIWSNHGIKFFCSPSISLLSLYMISLPSCSCCRQKGEYKSVEGSIN